MNRTSGFTLIEMLVSLALFTIVATVATGTLLSLIGGNARIVEEQTVMQSLSFALDSMTREIRTGSEYYCGTVLEVTSTGVTDSTTAVNDCGSGSEGLSFREGGESLSDVSAEKRIAYYVENGAIMRQIGNDDPESLVSDEVMIEELRFYVEGSDALSDGSDVNQPAVTIVVRATSAGGELERDFTLQSTVTQRALDI